MEIWQDATKALKYVYILEPQTSASRSFYKNIIAMCTHIYVSRSSSKCHLEYFKNGTKFQTVDEVNFWHHTAIN